MIGYIGVHSLLFCRFLYALQHAGGTSASCMGAIPKEYLVMRLCKIWASYDGHYSFGLKHLKVPFFIKKRMFVGVI